MTSNRTDRRRTNDGLPSKLSKRNDGEILADSLDIVRKQEEIMAHLLNDLEFFRKKFKRSLEYDSGAGDYDEEWGDGTLYDVRYETDAGNGMIKEETMVNFVGYKLAMDNFQMGFNKTKDQIEKIWEASEGGEDSLAVPQSGLDGLEEDSLAIPQFELDGLARGRKIAAQE